ncbi:RHS repeat-associated core domain-containing protein, partial [Streptomyces sp. WMMB 714]|uniref:RHS repeat-associated core domain-containing protein n=1 Tax=Streptomyces sp. WMMB 714 TaxID=1286822 RepID=UPI000823C0BE
ASPTGSGGIDCPLRYPGQYADDESGLHYNNQRYYDPETARYLAPDPLGLDPADNHHGYVHNPLAWIDPLGLESCNDLKFEPSPKHGKEQRGNAAPESLNPQETLEKSIEYNQNTTRRVAANYDTGEFAIFDETHNDSGIFHGHSREWGELNPQQQAALRKAGMVNKKGKILPQDE